MKILNGSVYKLGHKANNPTDDGWVINFLTKVHYIFFKLVNAKSFPNFL